MTGDASAQLTQHAHAAESTTALLLDAALAAKLAAERVRAGEFDVARDLASTAAQRIGAALDSMRGDDVRRR
jgi:hypothetical protein